MEVLLDQNSIIGIVGAGAMGIGIAQVAATAGHKVVLYDRDPEKLAVSRKKLEKVLARLVEKGRMEHVVAIEIQNRIQDATHNSDYFECDFIIEAIVEDLEIKKELFRSLESYTKTNTILATNTSSLPVTSIAAACTDPSRVLGTHFFNPAPLMKLVEVIPGIQTDGTTLDLADNLIKSWGKTTVIARDTPGFIVNRIARPYYSEALWMLEEGMADVATIDWAMTALGGFRMGPFALMDFIGNDVNFHVTTSMYRAYFEEPRYRPSFTQQRLLQAGYLGKKAGLGFYSYGENAINPEPNKDPVLGEEILNRIRFLLINEAADAYHKGVAGKEEIDIAMTTGVNYPKGLLKWADEIGISHIVSKLDNLYDFYREPRYRCSPLLKKMHQNKENFFQ